MRYKDTKGDDTLVGGDTNDIFTLKSGHDTVDGGLGYDTLGVDYSNVFNSGAPSVIRIDSSGAMSGVLTGGVGNDVSFTAIEEVTYTGAQGDDRVLVEAATGLGANRFLTLDGGAGVDTFEFHTGSRDGLFFAVSATGFVNSSEMVLSGFERYRLFLGAGDDYIELGDRDDLVSGGRGSDFLSGGNGDDVLIGGRGSDTLIGGHGADTYLYTKLAELTSGADSIVNFEGANGDKIDLSRVDADASLAGKQHFTFVGEDAFTGAGGSAYELRIAEQHGIYAVIAGDVNHDGVADFHFTVGTDQPVTAGDFVL